MAGGHDGVVGRVVGKEVVGDALSRRDLQDAVTRQRRRITRRQSSSIWAR